ncbi:MAG: phage terminase large subunit [Candidatus Omnitrophota bacterium]|nr:phage terminase large subunit [Candidatus Omnitrophota bacterium]
MSNINNSERELRKSLGEKSIEAFARLYFSHYLKNEICSFHKDLYRILMEMVSARGKHTAIAAPRDSAKSSIVSLIYVLWCICYRKEPYMVILSETHDQAVDLLSHVKDELDSNNELIEDFPEACDIDKAAVWKEDEVITANRIKIIALGAGQKIRGRRNKQFRPSLVILDDIEGDMAVRNLEQRKKLYEWFTKAVLNAGSENTNYIVIGTILDYDSLLAKLISDTQEKKWDKYIYKAVVSFSKNQQLWDNDWSRILDCQDGYKDKEGPEGALEFFKDHEKEMMEGVSVLWEDKESFYQLMLARAYNEASFNSEKQNEPLRPEEQSLSMNEARFWDDEFKTEEALLKSLSDDIQVVGALDPSLGLKGKSGDFSAIITLVKDNKTGIAYVLDADIEKLTLDNLYEAVVEHCRNRRYGRFVIEENNFQAAVILAINERLSERGIDFSVEGKGNFSDKKGRIQMLQSPIKRGKIRFSRKHAKLLEQLKYFPRGSHDDGPDALQMAFEAADDDNHRTRWLPLTGGDDYMPGSAYWTEHDRLTKDPNAKYYGDAYNDYDDGGDD